MIRNGDAHLNLLGLLVGGVERESGVMNQLSILLINRLTERTNTYKAFRDAHQIVPNRRNVCSVYTA